MGRVRRTGILGGSFDPPHIGHLILAQCACEQFELETVQWVIAADPPHKQSENITKIATRIEMVRAAIRDNKCFVFSRLDIDRPGPHYTIDMLELASNVFKGNDLYFLLGSDSVHDLHAWHQPHRLGEHARLAVMRRTGSLIEQRELDKLSPKLYTNLVMIDGPSVDISSTMLRDLVRKKKSIQYLVPSLVEKIIERRGLYKHHA